MKSNWPTQEPTATAAVNFARNLAQCYERLAQREVLDGDLETVKGFALRILEQPVEPLPGVAETLEYLASRHDLALFTKGHPEEQKLKIDRSGLGIWFGHTAIVKEKDVASYRLLVEQMRWPPATTWMIGNSPKSDINPAMEAGLNAVFVPHERTWTWSACRCVSPARAGWKRVEQFSGLKDLF
jgi:putative hydrolase of the HAD superfamily